MTHRRDSTVRDADVRVRDRRLATRSKVDNNYSLTFQSVRYLFSLLWYSFASHHGKKKNACFDFCQKKKTYDFRHSSVTFRMSTLSLLKVSD